MEQRQYSCSLVALLLYRIKLSSEPGPSVCVPASSSASRSRQAAASESTPKAVRAEGAGRQLTSPRRSQSLTADVRMPANSADNQGGEGY